MLSIQQLADPVQLILKGLATMAKNVLVLFGKEIRDPPLAARLKFDVEVTCLGAKQRDAHVDKFTRVPVGEKPDNGVVACERCFHLRTYQWLNRIVLQCHT